MTFFKSGTTAIDKSAITLSMLCMAHCLLLPVALSLLPALSALPLADEHFHQMLAVAVLPISALALLFGCWKHRTWSVVLICALGLVILAGTALFGHDLLGEIGEKAATVIGAAVIAYGHVRNMQLCRAAGHTEAGVNP